MSISTESAGLSPDRSIACSAAVRTSDENHYRVAAFPAAHALTDDVILRDEVGRAYLLSHDDERPTPIEEDTANSLGMFFEPSQDYSWHTMSELRRIIYGVDEAVVTLR